MFSSLGRGLSAVRLQFRRLRPLAGNPSRAVWRFSGLAAWAQHLRLPPGDLLHDRVFRRIWLSTLFSSLGGQITLLALPLTAALMLNASPTQMGLLTAMEIAPFVLFSLPAGVWLDRVRKLPVYVSGEVILGLAVASVPVAAWMGWLSMTWLYAVGFVLGLVYTIAGSAAQVVLTQIVPRERLVEAHAKNALASSGAEVAGPGLAGALIKLLGAPWALVVNAVLVLVSALILRGVQVKETVHPRTPGGFTAALREGLRFVAGQRLLPTLAAAVGCWQFFYNSALVVQIIYATRSLHLSAQGVGLSYVALGVGTVLASIFGNRLSARLGPGPSLTLGLGLSASGWLALGLAPTHGLGVAAFAYMLFAFGAGAVLIFINFLSLRQAVTPAPLLGRMTSTMRWLILLPAGPGALLGGWLGEHFGLRVPLLFAGSGGLLLSLVVWRLSIIPEIRVLPAQQPEPESPIKPADSGLSAQGS
jgi:MFS family permease